MYCALPPMATVFMSLSPNRYQRITSPIRLLKNSFGWDPGIPERRNPHARSPTPKDQPRQRIKAVADAVLERRSPVSNRMYVQVDRASVPLEQPLKATLRTEYRAIRSDLLRGVRVHPALPLVPCMDLLEPSIDATVFTKNRTRLLRKDRDRETRLSFLGHALMENRNGLRIDFTVSQAIGTAERNAVPELLDGVWIPRETAATIRQAVSGRSARGRRRRTWPSAGTHQW